MKKLWLIRHGQTDYNAQNKIQGSGIDAPLNALGISQANLVAKAIKKHLNGAIPALFSSSLIRAKQTATVISEQLNLPFAISKEIVELNFGELEGLEIDTINGKLQHLHEQWEAGQTSVGAVKGESPIIAFERASNYIEAQLNSAEATNCIFVLHGRLLRILLAGWLDNNLSEMAKYQHHNANINLLNYDNGIFKPIILNDFSHLAELT